MPKKIIGFSKLSRKEQITWIGKNFLNNSEDSLKILDKYLNSDVELQSIHNSFSENSISNFYLPFSISPNFLINNKNYCIPIVTEESSVVAALSNSGKFWYDNGGFVSNVINKVKTGQIHFNYSGDVEGLFFLFNKIKARLIKSTDDLTAKMQERGGGILRISLIDNTTKIENYYQLAVEFDTVDSMGANFINSCLETIAINFKNILNSENKNDKSYGEVNIIMSILSNYTPECIVESIAECTIDKLNYFKANSDENLSEKIKYAFDIAQIDINRAVTHNKGIMNGIDSVLIATGNDFRSVEAGAHSYASNDGFYKGLSTCYLKENRIKFILRIPLSIGTIGGVTNLHPLVKLSHEMLGNPSSDELMQIICSVGLAQNFAAVIALVTSGIQKGHMKMHLNNLLIQKNATLDQIRKAGNYFNSKKIDNKSIDDYLKSNN